MRHTVYVFIALLVPFLSFAHVTVKPSEVGVSAWQTFNVSVPVERDLPTTGVRLLIPEGLEHVSPNVKPGWDIEIIKAGEGEEAMVREIVWTNGNIPAGMRDDFFFSAHVPPAPGALVWKAYQTYADGTVVSWDASESEQPKDANGEDDFSVRGPYSETAIINDLVKEEAPAPPVPVTTEPPVSAMPTDTWTALALAMAGAALFLVIRLGMRHNVG